MAELAGRTGVSEPSTDFGQTDKALRTIANGVIDDFNAMRYAEAVAGIREAAAYFPDGAVADHWRDVAQALDNISSLLGLRENLLLQ